MYGTSHRSCIVDRGVTYISLQHLIKTLLLTLPQFIIFPGGSIAAIPEKELLDRVAYIKIIINGVVPSK